MSITKLNNSRGDTIIEVLIAVAIVSSVLAGAYVAAGRSFNTTQVAKERDVALRVAETQVERLRGYKTQNPSAAVANNSCFGSAATPVANASFNADVTTDNLKNDASSLYNSSCRVSPSGAGAVYHTNILVSGNDYTVYVRWLRAGGGSNQETTLKYRYY